LCLTLSAVICDSIQRERLIVTLNLLPMSSNPLPAHLKTRFGVETADEMWAKILTEGNAFMRRNRARYARVPTSPRCRNCHRPFEGVGGAMLRITQGLHKSDKNPNYCWGCYQFLSEVPGGAEVELTMFFADIRGSTALAETMSPAEFGRLLNRFYKVAIDTLVLEDAFIDNLIGDEVSALFVPGFAGPDHAGRAIEAGRALLRETGHGQEGNPWVPLGIGIHTGIAWVGAVGGTDGAAADFTALGDNVNITARLASSSATGELLASEAAIRAAGLEDANLERRDLALKGKSQPVAVQVIRL
jgi:adenylate cyclase